VDLANGVSTLAAVIIGVGCFATAFVIVLWLGRGIDSHLVLNAVLMGLAATLIDIGLVAGSGPMSTALTGYGPATFVTVNAARLVGAAFGDIACERRRAVRPATV
jgi:hypothetical protein